MVYVCDVLINATLACGTVMRLSVLACDVMIYLSMLANDVMMC